MERAQVQNTDVISNLPKEIIDAILIRMPLKDAVRTSILSHRWRHKWVTISQLVFHNFDLGIHPLKSSRIVSIIDQVLLRHQGSIHKFELTALANCYHIDRWLLYLSGKGVKELILIISGPEAYKVPVYLFQCQELTRLQLTQCFLNPSSTFEGFPGLKSLELSGVDFGSYSVDKFISNCPVLERLVLLSRLSNSPFLEILKLSSFDHSLMKLSAPNIKILCIHILERSSRLVTSHFDLLEEGDTAEDSPPSDYNFLQAVSHFPNIIELEVGSLHGLRQCASDKVPRSLATTLDFLESLTLPVSFRNTNDILACLCLLRSSSNLRKLEIRGIHDHCKRKRLGNNWKADEDLDLYLENLHSVKFTGVVTLGPELEFIKAVVATSPVLEKLTIECSRFVTREMRFRISKNLYLLKTSSLTQIRIS